MISSGRARARADDLETRLARRRLELDMEADLHSSPPNIVAAALIVPQGLIDQLAGTPPDPKETADKMDTDRRRLAVVSVPDDPDAEPTVHYLVDPFRDYTPSTSPRAGSP